MAAWLQRKYLWSAYADFKPRPVEDTDSRMGAHDGGSGLDAFFPFPSYEAPLTRRRTDKERAILYTSPFFV